MDMKQIEAQAKLMMKVMDEVTTEAKRVLIEGVEELPDVDMRVGVMIAASTDLYASMLRAVKKACGDKFGKPQAKLIMLRFADEARELLEEVTKVGR